MKIRMTMTTQIAFLVSFLFLALSLSLPSTSFALVREEASCVTVDGAYSVLIFTSPGVGTHRPSPAPMTAIISDVNNDLVLSVPVDVDHGIKSASFGRATYIDLASVGNVLKLEGPSTNFRHYTLNARVQLNGVETELRDKELECGVFLGVVRASNL